VGAILEGEQTHHLIQAESEPLGRLDEADPLDITPAVAPDATRRPIGLVDQPSALIETNRLDAHLGGGRHGTDRECFRVMFHAA